jgi:two-component system, sensor histidine kinase LadS
MDASERITVTGDPNLHFVSDLNFFRVAIANLIDNALKYSPKDSVIKIDFHFSAGKQGSGLFVLVVNETGILGAPDPSQVFKKYYRNQSATKISGSGLGLFLVSELIKILDGEISYSLQEESAVFTIWIPD